MLKRLLLTAVAFLLFVFQVNVSTANALELTESTRTVKINRQGDEVVLSLEQVKRGENVFVDKCTYCHKSGTLFAEKFALEVPTQLLPSNNPHFTGVQLYIDVYGPDDQSIPLYGHSNPIIQTLPYTMGSGPASPLSTEVPILFDIPNYFNVYDNDTISIRFSGYAIMNYNNGHTAMDFLDTTRIRVTFCANVLDADPDLPVFLPLPQRGGTKKTALQIAPAREKHVYNIHSASQKSPSTIMLINGQGQVLSSTEVYGEKTAIDLRHLPRGGYFLWWSNAGERGVERLYRLE